ncbi:hypothetical protein D9M68_628100 [compost metagenome]
MGRGPAKAPLVERDAAELRAERLDLRGKHLMVQEESMTEDDRWRAASRVFEEDGLAVHIGVRHG